MDKEVVKIAKDIKSLKIQGARNVAKAGVRALNILAKNHKKDTKKQFMTELTNAKKLIETQRPTEPALRNSLIHILNNAQNSNNPQQSVITTTKEIENYINKAKEKIAEYGAKQIPNNSIILTHCHSSTANSVLIKAKQMKKKFTVIVTETRPVFQGIDTAKDLAKEGIDVIYIVDSAITHYLDKIDLFITGADAITAQGGIVNKIGTALMAEACYNRKIPYYVAASAFKFDQATINKKEPIEMRDTKEVATFKHKKIKVANPAFDETPVNHVTAIISDLGVLPPKQFVKKVMR